MNRECQLTYPSLWENGLGLDVGAPLLFLLFCPILIFGGLIFPNESDGSLEILICG
jgi:hypothetical protein